MQQIGKFLVTPCLVLSVAGCFGGSKDVSANIERAQRAIESGDRATAQNELQRALRINPVDPHANLAMAKLEDQEGDLQAAVPHYLRAATPDARLIDAQLRVIEILIDSNRLREAGGFLTATIGAFPGNIDALALRADLAERQDQSAAARVDAEAVLKKDPTNARATAVLALLALRDNDGPRALQAVNTALAKYPDDVRLLQVQAAALMTANQPDKAIAALRTISRSAPRNAMIQSALADLQAENGKTDDAMAGFKAAVAADPANQDMQLAFVKFLATRMPGADVVTYLKKLIADNPKSGIYDLALAGYYRGQAQLAESAKTLQAGADRLSSGPDAASLNVALARVQSERGNKAEARALLNGVLATDPGNEDALFFRAQQNLEAGRAQAAIDDIMAVVRANPVSTPAFQLLANAYLLQKEPKLAIEAMRRAVATRFGDDAAQLQMAAFLQGTGDEAGARDILARLTVSHPAASAVWLTDGQVAIARKDWSEAARAIVRLRQIPNSQSSASSLEGQLKTAQGNAAGGLQAYLNSLAMSQDVDPSLFGVIARAAIAAGQAEQTAQQLTQRIPLLKSTAQQSGWLAVTTLQMHAGHPDQADSAFQHAAALAPKDAGTYSLYIGLLAERKMFDRARQVAIAGLSAGASKSAMLLLQGWVQELAGDIPAAQASYHDALEADPLGIQAANNYANILVDREPKNVAALTKVRDRLNGAENNADPAIVDTIAWLDFRLGRLDEAKGLLTRINAAESTNPQLRFHLAAVLLASGDRTQGLALLDSVKGMDFPGADEAKSLSAT